MNGNEKNEKVLLLKGIAILSVIFAHCHNTINVDTIDTLLNQIAINIGTIGVPIFFICSGYLFHKKPILLFFRGKTRIVIAWVFTGSLIWMYEVIRKGIGYANYIEWIFGIGTYLWYMSTLFLIWFIFEIVNKKYIFILIFACMVLYIIGIEINILKVDEILYDVICFMPFFLTGYIVQEKKSKVLKLIDQCNVWSIAVILFGGMLINYNKLVYGCRLFFIIELAIALLIYKSINILERFDKIKIILKQLGENSFAIYLIHMPLAGVMSNIFSRFIIGRYMVLIYPVIVCLIINTFCEWAKKYVKRKRILGIIGL